MTDPRTTALEAELKSAKQEARLRVIFFAGVGLILALLIACLVYTVTAADKAGRAADAAAEQSRTNARLLEALQAANGNTQVLLQEVKSLNAKEIARFQALLDTIYGPGKVTLGEPADIPPRNTANDPDYDPRAGRRTSQPSPAPRPTKPPEPLTPPAPSPRPVPLPVPVPTPPPLLPVPLPTSSLLCRTLHLC